MKNWVNSGIIFRDKVIKAIVDLAIWFTLHRMQSLVKFTCVEKNHMGCPESNCTPTFYSSEYKSTPTRCGSLCLLSRFFFPSPSLSRSPSQSLSVSLSLFSLFFEPPHPRHSLLVTYLFESYLCVRFLYFMSRMLISRRGKCRMTVKQISQNVPSIVICF